MLRDTRRGPVLVFEVSGSKVYPGPHRQFVRDNGPNLLCLCSLSRYPGIRSPVCRARVNILLPQPIDLTNLSNKDSSQVGVLPVTKHRHHRLTLIYVTITGHKKQSSV